MMDRIQGELDRMRGTLKVDFLGIALSNHNHDTNSRVIRWRYVSGNINENYRRIRLQVGRGIAGIVWRTGRSYQATELQKDPKQLIELPITRMEKLETTIAVPMLKDGRVQGVLLCGYRQVTAFDEDLLRKLEAAAEQLRPLLVVG